MKFIDLKSKIENILVTSASGNFTLVGYQKEAVGASNVIGNNRLVQVFNQSGSFDGGYNASQQHDVTVKVVLTVSAANKADLTVLDNDNASTAAKQSALAAMRLSESICDAEFDNLLMYIWQIISDAQNHHLLETDNDNKPANLKIKNWTKDEPIRNTFLTTLTGNLEITYRIQEFITGAIPQYPATLDKFYDYTTMQFYDYAESQADSSGVQIEVTHDSVES